MPNQLVAGLSALGIALAPALLKFAEVPRGADLDVDADAETECVKNDQAPVHPRYQSTETDAHLAAGSVVQVTSKRKTWRHIAYVDGNQAALGWVTASNLGPCENDDDDEENPVSSGSMGPGAGHTHGSSSGVCATDLDECPESGCENEGTPHAIMNELKRRTAALDGSAITFDASVPVSFGELESLQTRASALVSGKNLTSDERARLESITVGGRKLGEGVAVRLSGFLAHHDPNHAASGTHLGGKESVNCRLSHAGDVDFHIPLIPTLGAEECEGVVVEMIPQGRDEHPSWTVQRLWEAEETRRPVLFVGPLFYDNEHRVNADCSALESGQPKRMSLWEIHPVVEFYVCEPGQTCQASSKSGWKRVD
jgi:hypothetical protein